MPRTQFKLMFVWLFLLAIAAERMSAQSAQTLGDDFFEKKIRSVLATNCYACHSSKLKSPMGGLVLDTKSGLLKGGDSGPVIVPGKPDQSLLLRALRYNDPVLKMPPTNKLADAVIADFEQWIAAGAPDPRTETVSTITAPKRGIDFEKGRQWWSFQPVREQAAPAIQQTAWPRTKIDRFILAKLEQNKLKPSAEADPRILILRASLDLTGLKPSYEEVEHFVNDKDPRRYEKLIDRLLADERYADHEVSQWLDALAENPTLINASLNSTGPFRWFLLDSLRDHKALDRMVTELLMMRGDAAHGGSAGFAQAGENDAPFATKGHIIAAAFLGVELQCARCHDSPYHSTTQRDLYSLAAMLERKTVTVPKTSRVPAAFFEKKARESLIRVTLKPDEPVTPVWPFAAVTGALENADLDALLDIIGPDETRRTLIELLDVLREKLGWVDPPARD